MGKGKPRAWRPGGNAKLPPKYKIDSGKPQVPGPWKGNQKGQNSGNGAQSSVSQSITQGHEIETDYASEQRHGLEDAMDSSSFDC